MKTLSWTFQNNLSTQYYLDINFFTAQLGITTIHNPDGPARITIRKGSVSGREEFIWQNTTGTITLGSNIQVTTVAPIGVAEKRDAGNGNQVAFDAGETIAFAENNALYLEPGSSATFYLRVEGDVTTVPVEGGPQTGPFLLRAGFLGYQQNQNLFLAPGEQADGSDAGTIPFPGDAPEPEPTDAPLSFIYGTVDSHMGWTLKDRKGDPIMTAIPHPTSYIELVNIQGMDLVRPNVILADAHRFRVTFKIPKMFWQQLDQQLDAAALRGYLISDLWASRLADSKIQHDEILVFIDKNITQGIELDKDNFLITLGLGVSHGIRTINVEG